MGQMQGLAFRDQYTTKLRKATQGQAQPPPTATTTGNTAGDITFYTSEGITLQNDSNLYGTQFSVYGDDSSTPVHFTKPIDPSFGPNHDWLKRRVDEMRVRL